MLAGVSEHTFVGSMLAVCNYLTVGGFHGATGGLPRLGGRYVCIYLRGMYSLFGGVVVGVGLLLGGCGWCVAVLRLLDGAERL